MKVKSMKKNYIYNLVLTVVNMIFPLITAPYLSYVLGAENIGKVNYATSIISWFILFASFGIPRYGIREIARNRDNKKELTNSFWNLLLIQVIISFITIILYLIIIFNIKVFRQDINLYILMVIMIILNIFSIDWFYQGIEEYGYITSRNLIFKLISIILIFTMINDRDDYLMYALINILALSFNNILNYFNTKKYIDKKLYNLRFLYYIKELRVYFITTLIIALYTQLDQTFIGAKSQKDLAYYVRSKTVLGVGFSIVNSLITIFIPRTAYLAESNYNEYKKIVNKSINYIYILSFPCFVGVLLLSGEIMLLLGGAEFLPARYSLQITSILVIITSVGSWQINQVLLPNKLENLALKIQTIAAIISILLNIILIKKFSYIGAAISWLITEISLTTLEGIFIRLKCRELKIKYFNKSAIKYFISVIIMGVVILLVKKLIKKNIYIIATSLIVGPISYFGMIILLKDNIIIELINQLKIKLKGRKL
ncbi:flippase [Clostridium perfringens]|uniref:flippase n=2 Tax=Clostridium perfringens TaxID=1502 RepID=UPI001A2E9A96|nr:flippase [Clostridium perfringens]EHK2363932.1 flippase [Clostridium perfringens]MDT7963412.1 flippase [Clostridium perfringens]MDU2086227.1 flippase [Clostridium perfringens]MDU8977468.1 flippase [Clostridium perfringens]HAT4355692.1 flippase [Clostridium perfringens]